jgi:hypothetical protein
MARACGLEVELEKVPAVLALALAPAPAPAPAPTPTPTLTLTLTLTKVPVASLVPDALSDWAPKEGEVCSLVITPSSRTGRPRRARCVP